MVEIRNFTRKPVSKLPYQRIAEDILGDSYDLSLVFIGKKRSRDLNLKWREKDKVANVLSFPYDKQSGEIFITPSSFPQGETLRMFIHASLHLKGFDHSGIMDDKEEILMEKWHETLSQG